MTEERKDKRVEGFRLGAHYMVGEVVDDGAQLLFVTDKRLSSKKNRSVDSMRFDKNRIFVIFKEKITESFLAEFAKTHDLEISERLSFAAGVVVKTNGDLFETMNKIMDRRDVDCCEPIEVQKISHR